MAEQDYCSAHRLLTTVVVEVPWDLIQTLPVTEKDDVIEPLSVCTPEVSFSVHVNVTSRDADDDDGEDAEDCDDVAAATPEENAMPAESDDSTLVDCLMYFYFDVCVCGLDEDSHVLVKGSVSRVLRDWLKDDSSGYVPPAECLSVASLSSRGMLASLLFGHTRSFTVNLLVYSTESCAPPAPASVAALRDLHPFHDVVLRVTGRDFPAHKVVLAAGSPVFLSMFSGSFKESGEKLVEMNDVTNADAFEKMIEFLYTARVEDWADRELELLMLADRFLVEPLKAECEQRLLAVGVDKALDLLWASVEQPSIPKAVRCRATALLLDNWEILTAASEWADFQAAHSAAASVLEAAHEVYRSRRLDLLTLDVGRLPGRAHRFGSTNGSQ